MLPAVRSIPGVTLGFHGYYYIRDIYHIYNPVGGIPIPALRPRGFYENDDLGMKLIGFRVFGL